MLPYSRQSIDDTDIAAVVEVLKSDWLTTGPAVEKFERGVAEFVGAETAVALCNGTAALHAAMSVLGIGPGDEVIVPAITFVATANAVLYQGARPVFADVCPQTLLIDPASVSSLITPRTRAVVAVDYAGQPADYPALRQIADRHGLALIADACHSLGGSLLRFSSTCAAGPEPVASDGYSASSNAGRREAASESKVGTLADLTCFSFHPVKPMTTGEGGMVVALDPTWSSPLRAFRNHGIDRDFRQREQAGGHAYGMTQLGFNYRMCDIQAALGSSQLRRLNEWTERRRQLWQRYATRLQDLTPWVAPLEVREVCRSAHHLQVVRLRVPGIRDQVFQDLRRRGIGVNVHYLPVYRHPHYQENLGYSFHQCPEAEAAYNEILSLPLFPEMRESDVDDVVEKLGEAVRHALDSGVAEVGDQQESSALRV